MLVIRLLVAWAVLAVSIGVAAWLLSSVRLAGGPLALLGVIVAAFVISVISTVLEYVVDRLMAPRARVHA